MRFIEQLEGRQFLSAGPLDAIASPHVPVMAAAVATKTPSVGALYTGIIRSGSAGDGVVMSVTKKTPSPDGKSLKLNGTVRQIMAGLTLTLVGRVNLASRAVSLSWRGAATGTGQGTFSSNFASVNGTFTTTYQGRTSRGSFDADAVSSRLRRNVMGQYSGNYGATLAINKQSGSGVVSGTVDVPKLSAQFDGVALVNYRTRSIHMRLEGDGDGFAIGSFSADWSRVSGSVSVVVDGKAYRTTFSLARK